MVVSQGIPRNPHLPHHDGWLIEMQNETRKEIPATLIPGDGIGSDIAGKGLNNPLAMPLAAAMMLDYRIFSQLIS